MSTEHSLRPTKAWISANRMPRGVQLPSPYQCARARQKMIERRRHQDTTMIHGPRP